MNYIRIEKGAKGYDVGCPGTPKGMPVPLGTPVRFARGIPGFEQIRIWRFEASVDVHPFLQMVAEDDSVRFVCIESFRICRDYRLHLPFSSAAPLAIAVGSRVAVMSIVTVNSRPEDITANLMSPIVVNADTCQGEQLIPESSPYPLKYRIWDHLQVSEADDEPSEEVFAVMG